MHQQTFLGNPVKPVIDWIHQREDKTAGLTKVMYANGHEELLDISGTLTSEQIPDAGNAVQVVIGNGVTEIGQHCFENCAKLEVAVMSDTVEAIRAQAFRECTSLQMFEFGRNLKVIDAYAFQNDENLQTVVLHASLTMIVDSAFIGCTRIKKVTIPQAVCSSKLQLKFPNSYQSITDVIILDSVERLGNEVFRGCNSLTSVMIPNGVMSIGNYAFDSCSGLMSVMMPDSIKTIGPYAFRYCRGLASVTIPNNVTSIGYYAFRYCNGLTSVTIGNSVIDIGKQAFSGCTGLTSVTIPNSVTSIAEGAFEDCSGLTSVIIPNSVTSIGEDAFSGCSGLTVAEFKGRTLAQVKAILDANGNPQYSWGLDESVVHAEQRPPVSQFNFLYKIADGTEWQEWEPQSDDIQIVNKQVTIKAVIFKEQSWFANVREVKLLNKWKHGSEDVDVTSIGSSAFEGCSGLTSVSIPDSVTSIGHEAFYGCSGLTVVTIPGSVTNIGQDAFYNCTSVNDVYCYPNPANLTWYEDDQDDFKEDGSTLCHVKAEYLTAYQTKFGDEVNVTFVGDLT